MRPPRFRLRTLLIAVAVMGVALGAWGRIEGRRARMLGLAEEHRSRIVGLSIDRDYARLGVSLCDITTGYPLRPVTPGERRRDRWHFRLYLKYQDAAARPWLPVAPDPPPPE